MKELMADFMVLLMQAVMRNPDALEILERLHKRVGPDPNGDLLSDELIIGLRIYRKYLWLTR